MTVDFVIQEMERMPEASFRYEDKFRLLALVVGGVL